MTKYSYKKKRNNKLFIKLFSVSIIFIGGLLLTYTFFPLLSWQVYFAPAFATSAIDSPIPSHSVNTSEISNLIESASESLNSDYTNANNWYPGYQESNKKIISYTISIPEIGIENAVVSNKDTDLSKHLVQYNSDSLPPKQGNSVIFGHSTLPQLYNENDYKTIFANAYKLKAGDKIIVNSENTKYTYKIESVTVVNPDDTSVLSQNFSDSYITLITCTPPGTLWKRLIIKGRIDKI